jgi:cell division protein FtsA
MKIEQPYLFIEINDKKIIFLAVKYNEDFNFETIHSLSIKSEGVLNGKIIDPAVLSKIIKKNINLIEKKINFIFKNATIINDQNDFNCINVSGFKKLSGSQISNEDISYILNSIKKLIEDNEPQKSLIHIFNSNFILDNNILNKIPIGLYGDFYNQHLTLFLLKKNDLKNLKLVLNNCHINIERIVLKPFVSGINKIKKDKVEEMFFLINLDKNKSSISIFNNLSFIYSETFSFGTDIIMKDVSKLCSINLDSVKDIFAEIKFENADDNIDKKYLDKKYFKDTNFRNISLTHLKNIISARAEELIDLIYKKNINLKYLEGQKKSIFFEFEDVNFFKNLGFFFKKNFSEKQKVVFLESNQNEPFDACLESAELIGKGWEKEAIPVVQTKKSIISRIFSNFFN